MCLDRLLQEGTHQVERSVRESDHVDRGQLEEQNLDGVREIGRHLQLSDIEHRRCLPGSGRASARTRLLGIGALSVALGAWPGPGRRLVAGRCSTAWLLALLLFAESCGSEVVHQL